ncbi:MAG: GNAT family N-acetyltransferase [Armatimonadota bacterium]|nr:MAG: GNAT family N-acetyltransferase [Armatimonadota bacterium]
MMRLPNHDLHLADDQIRLRPFTESDFKLIARWFKDPEVLHFSEGAENPNYSRAEIESIYRGAADKWDALLFVIETTDGKAVGETWLERMNLQRALKEPSDNPWRIDIMIGEKDCWGQGYGRRAVRLLLRHAFEALGADRVGAPVFEFNERSLRMFQACGMHIVRRVPDTVKRGDQRFADLDLEITREDWLSRHDDA